MIFGRELAGRRSGLDGIGEGRRTVVQLVLETLRMVEVRWNVEVRVGLWGVWVGLHLSRSRYCPKTAFVS